MFIRRRQYNQIISRLNTLERQSETHGRFLHRDYEALKSHKNKIDEVIKTVGVEEPSVLDSMLHHYFGRPFGMHVEPHQKPLTLVQKVSQVMDHLGLYEKTTSASVKLAKKPEPKAKATLKGKK